MTRKSKLTKSDQWIEDHLDEFVSVPGPAYDAIVAALERKKNGVVLEIRVNRDDLEAIKRKAFNAGVSCKAFIYDILHKAAQA